MLLINYEQIFNEVCYLSTPVESDNEMFHEVNLQFKGAEYDLDVYTLGGEITRVVRWEDGIIEHDLNTKYIDKGLLNEIKKRV